MDSARTNSASMSSTRRAAEPRPREQLLRVLVAELDACRIPVDQSVLIVGGSAADEQLLRQVGFKDILNSNLPTDMDRLNGEEWRAAPKPSIWRWMPSRWICRPIPMILCSPLKFCITAARHTRRLCEMLRVSRRYVVFMEPNDSAAMNALVKMNFSFPYELPAVIAHDYQSGGLRDSNIPNFIYRWNRHEVVKTVSSCIPERMFYVRAHPYWDFSVTKEELDRRKATRIGTITSLIGARNFIALLRVAQLTMNLLPPLRGQGNKFFCCIDKGVELKPWMAREGKDIVYNRQFGS